MKAFHSNEMASVRQFHGIDDYKYFKGNNPEIEKYGSREHFLQDTFGIQQYMVDKREQSNLRWFGENRSA